MSLYILAPQESKQNVSIKFPLPDYIHSLKLHITEGKKRSAQPLSVSAFLTDGLDRGGIETEQTRISLLVGIVKVLEAYMQLYGSTAAFVETFEPTLAIVKSIAD